VAEGDTDGWWLGRSDGLSPEGNEDGCLLGEAESRAEGLPEGDIEGSTERGAIGVADGNADG
jgi:hypothetical protein